MPHPRVSATRVAQRRTRIESEMNPFRGWASAQQPVSRVQYSSAVWRLARGSRGCSSMVEPQSSKLITRVRFSSSPRNDESARLTGSRDSAETGRFRRFEKGTRIEWAPAEQSAASLSSSEATRMRLSRGSRHPLRNDRSTRPAQQEHPMLWAGCFCPLSA